MWTELHNLMDKVEIKSLVLKFHGVESLYFTIWKVLDYELEHAILNKGQCGDNPSEIPLHGINSTDLE